MGYARQALVCLNDTPYYHVIARCVRRAWLWGFDDYAGRDYSHRKDWVLARLQFLSTIFAVDICAYAVMSDHYHLVLHVDQARAFRMSKPEVVERWSELFTLPSCVKRWQEGLAEEAEAELAERVIEQWRQRMIDVSWFMRCLNEHLARRANAEDGCTGRFWEGRFKSQALLDEAGLLTAMAYVDLNPVRAGMARTPEESAFTSIYSRVHSFPVVTSGVAARRYTAPVRLLAFRDCAKAGEPALPLSLRDYLQLVDWSGRSVRADKAGAIDEGLPPILQRLDIDASVWQDAMRIRGNVFGRALGKLNHMRLHARTLQQSRIKGQRQAGRLYRTA
jgi:REP element-mobilizing transposase RayT